MVVNTTYLGGEGDPEEPLLRRPPRPPLLSGVEPRDLDLVRDLERPRGGVLESWLSLGGGVLERDRYRFRFLSGGGVGSWNFTWICTYINGTETVFFNLASFSNRHAFMKWKLLSPFSFWIVPLPFCWFPACPLPLLRRCLSRMGRDWRWGSVPCDRPRGRPPSVGWRWSCPWTTRTDQASRNPRGHAVSRGTEERRKHLE